MDVLWPRYNQRYNSIFFLICIQKVFDKFVSLSYTIFTTKVIGGEQYV
jgi:hypothetical protein